MLNFRDTVLPIALAVLCCALPILLISGVSIGGGLLLGETALVVAGLGGIGYVVYRVARRRRRL
jgi:hydrogenase maturation factor HypE